METSPKEMVPDPSECGGMAVGAGRGRELEECAGAARGLKGLEVRPAVRDRVVGIRLAVEPQRVPAIPAATSEQGRVDVGGAAERAGPSPDEVDHRFEPGGMRARVRHAENTAARLPADRHARAVDEGHEIDLVQRDDAAEPLGEAAHLENGPSAVARLRGSALAKPGGDGFAARGLHRGLHLILDRGGARSGASPPGQALRSEQHHQHQAQAEEEPAPQGEVGGGKPGHAQTPADPPREERGLRENDAIEHGDEHG